MNFSSDTRHAAERMKENIPHLFFAENTVEPSARIVAVNR